MRYRDTHEWAALTRAQIAEARGDGALPVLPFGSIEQHGDHLPIGTDSFCVDAVATRAAAAAKAADPTAPHVLVLPTLRFGFSPHHKDWPGTITLSANTVHAMIEDVAESLYRTGFKRLLIVNGHGGNQGPLTTACTALASRGREVGWVTYFDTNQADWLPQLPGELRGVGHACAYETALVMALRPDLAPDIAAAAATLPPRLAQPYATDETDPVRQQRIYFAPVFASSDVGYVGEPALATPQLGTTLLDQTVAGLARCYNVFGRAGLRTGAP